MINKLHQNIDVYSTAQDIAHLVMFRYLQEKIQQGADTTKSDKN